MWSSASAKVTGPEPGSRWLESKEILLRRPLTRRSQFAAVQHVGPYPTCSKIQVPQALLTPDPLWEPNHERPRVQVSFIVGIDGRVYSPLILESAGLSGDRRVLQTVLSWRFRPAMCNGAPTETEGQVSFSSR